MRSYTRHVALFTLTVLVLLASDLAFADNVYVSCRGGVGTIEKIDSSGNKSVFASGLGYYNPQGLAFDNRGNLYLASRNDTIEKFDSSGNGTIFASGLNDPTGLAFDSVGNLYAACTTTIYKFNSSGTRTVFADHSSGIYSPFSIVFDNSNNLYVSNDYDAILKYDSSGHGAVFASVDNACSGITIDRNSNLYLACNTSWSGWIEKYDSSGNITTFASGLPAGLTGLAFDSSGNLYAANFVSGTIEKFDSSGNGTLFASGLDDPMYIATQVPEPATLLLLGLGAVMLRKKR